MPPRNQIDHPKKKAYTRRPYKPREGPRIQHKPIEECAYHTKAKRNELIRQMRLDGVEVKRIMKRFRISRQRVHQILGSAA